LKQDCVVLTSGGIDSTTLLYLLASQNYLPHPLFVDYGQLTADIDRCAVYEIYFEARKRFELMYPRTIELNLRKIAISTLLGTREVITQTEEETLVPGRNMLLLAIAAS